MADQTERMNTHAIPVSRTRSIAFVGLSVALIAASAWVTVPLGSIPFTLQMLAIPLMISLLRPSEAIAAIYVYVAIGALGLPVFSGMRGGIGVLMGPTGGFLIGYLIGVPLAAGLLYLVRKRTQGKSTTDVLTHGKGWVAVIRSGSWEIAAGLVFTVVAYICGLVQYTFVAGVGLEVAFATSVAPFIVPDILKVVLAALCAQTVSAALGFSRRLRS